MAEDASDFRPHRRPRLIPVADGEFIAVTVERLEESSERIHAKRVRLVDTLFRDNFEYFGG